MNVTRIDAQNFMKLHIKLYLDTDGCLSTFGGNSSTGADVYLFFQNFWVRQISATIALISTKFYIQNTIRDDIDAICLDTDH